tara:strand:- start:3033 stop:3359 length:327 start_codon:yes stop_codon:yes gene_type:complete
MTNTTYNGWTNYQTWRVNLEMIDDSRDHYLEQIKEMVELDKDISELNLTSELSEMLKSDVENLLECETYNPDNSMVLSYAMAFVNECNFWEIAENILIDYWSEYFEAV